MHRHYDLLSACALGAHALFGEFPHSSVSPLRSAFVGPVNDRTSTPCSPNELRHVGHPKRQRFRDARNNRGLSMSSARWPRQYLHRYFAKSGDDERPVSHDVQRQHQHETHQEQTTRQHASDGLRSSKSPDTARVEVRCRESDPEKMFSLGKRLHLRRHRSKASRALALRLFRECLERRPAWREMDTKFAVDSGINHVFEAFAIKDDAAASDSGRINNSEGGLDVDTENAKRVMHLRFKLAKIGYNASHVLERLGGTRKAGDGRRLPGPYYLRKGTDHRQVASLGPPRDALDVAIRMFLLGLAVSRTVVEQTLGRETLGALHHLGMIGECPVDDSLVVSLVQLFPLDATVMLPSSLEPQGRTPRAMRPARDEKSEGEFSHRESIASASDLVFATDWPPPGSTALEEEPVMYIGPDSVGLVQHAPQAAIVHEEASRTGSGARRAGRDNPRNSTTKKDLKDIPEGDSSTEAILDLCCGSGVQGIAAAALREGNAVVTCVDINPRAVRFARFNACLNGMDNHRFRAVVGDLYDALRTYPAEDTTSSRELQASGASQAKQGLEPRQDPAEDSSLSSVRDTVRDGGSPPPIGKDVDSVGYHRIASAAESPTPHTTNAVFDLILANPPFVPVPPKADAIRRRYDLFASGGSSGEDVLSRVLAGALTHLRPGGMLAVVSELANPSSFDAKVTGWIERGRPHGPRKVSVPKRPTRGGEASIESGEGDGTRSFDNEASPAGETNNWVGLVFYETNAWRPSEYAARRAGSDRETDSWARHLEIMGIETMAPGFVFIRRARRDLEEGLDTPKHRGQGTVGSNPPVVQLHEVERLWAPHNKAAVEYTRFALRQL